MRRRIALGSIAVAALVMAPLPAGSAAAAPSPRVHSAGIELRGPSGGPRAAVPRLVRAGSERRRDPGTTFTVSERGRAPLGPVVVPPTFDGVPDLRQVSPGDPTGALGVSYHLAAVNVHMAFYDRLGVELDPPRRLRNLDPLLSGSAVDFDPKVVYDPYRARFVLAFASATATNSFLSIVVIREGSEADPGTWCTLHMSGDQVTGDGKQFADYPMVGFTENRLTLTTNQFDYSAAPRIGGFRYVQVVSFAKNSLYNCNVDPVPIKVFGGNQTRDPDGSRAFTIVPTISTGGAPKTQMMASLDFGRGRGKLILWRLKPVTGILRLSRVQFASGAMAYPPFGRQCGGTSSADTKWDTGDLRLTSSFWDGDLGRLYSATAIRGNVGGGGAESVVRWWEVDPAPRLRNSDVTRKGTVGAAGRDVAWPSVATDGDGKLWVNYARAGLAGGGQCLSGYAGVVQPGSRVASSVLYQGSAQRYEFTPASPVGLERWGDYTAITRDPVNPTLMAAYGAYPIDDGTGNGTLTKLWQEVIATLEDV